MPWQCVLNAVVVSVDICNDIIVGCCYAADVAPIHIGQDEALQICKDLIKLLFSSLAKRAEAPGLNRRF